MNDATQFFDSGGGGYQIERSLRFNPPDSAYLSRTPASAGNLQTWTWAGWVKRSVLSSGSTDRSIFYALGTGQVNLQFYRNNCLRLYTSDGTTGTFLDTPQVFRDCSAWYHIVVAFDTTQAVASDRIKLYVNGSQITNLSGTYIAQNAATAYNRAVIHQIGWAYSDSYVGSYLADIHSIDGQALDPTSFGEFDDNGIWQPKAYTGSYGTNGFHLPFSDNSTAAALGTDTSGNGNTWTVNNISVAAGAGNDSLVDTPTSYGTDTGAGGEVRGNYCTLNPLSKSSLSTLSNGNLDIATNSSGYPTVAAYGSFQIPSSGKWYWEYTPTNNATYSYCGITQPQNLSKYARYYGATGAKEVDGVNTAYGSSLANNDVIGVAVDVDGGIVRFYKNNVSQGDITYSTSSGLFAPSFGDGTNGVNITYVVNFGQRPFAYAAPSGYKALCTTNLPEPTIADGSSAMDVKLYTGNGGTQTISGLGFSPDFVWIKSRSVAADNTLYDAVRGATKKLYSNTNGAEQTDANGLTAFTSDGFSLGDRYEVNNSGSTFAGWCWDAGSSTVTNNAGSISSQVRANPSAGFSIATFTTPTSGTFTVGHGLNVSPSLVICKARNQVNSWYVYHKAVGANKYLILESQSAYIPNTNIWQNTDPSSTLVYGGVSSWGTADYVMYSFAPVEGYSAFGSYTGNGSVDGPFVSCNFRPRWVLLKASSTTGNWFLLDTARLGYNQDNYALYPNLSASFSTTTIADILSNGFKLRQSDISVNGSAQTYIYAAFAENPFKTSRAR